MNIQKTEKLKSYLTAAVFLGGILGGAVACLLHPTAANSLAERRPLAQLPTPTVSSVENGTFFSKFDDYAVDQFPARDFFRSVKANFQLSVLNISENNQLAVEDGYIAKINTGLNSASLENAAKKLQNIYDTYLLGTDTRNFLAIVPDKGYFFGRDFGYPAPNYAKLTEEMCATLPDFSYIDLFPHLELANYYRTDTHWRQETLPKVAALIAENMGLNLQAEYQTAEFSPFRGVYFGQSALNPQPDTLRYLTNEVLDGCTVYDYETEQTMPIYNLDKLATDEPYDVFLSGTKALLRIDNPSATTDRNLVLFRDSYGSSLAPLLAEGYASIVLVDLRYISPQYLGNYLEFSNQDVMFLYSTLLLNDSFALK